MCYFLVEIYTLQSQVPFITSTQTKVNDNIKTPSSCSSSTLHVSMTSAPQDYWQHGMKCVIAVIIIARRMNWMTHWSIEDNEKGGDTFALTHQYVWDGTKLSGEYSAPDEALDRKTMTRVGSNYTPIPPAHSPPYPLCFLVLTDSFTPISGLPTRQL